jgi:hypothetical protein
MVGYSVFYSDTDVNQIEKNSKNWIWIHRYGIHIKIGYEYGYPY